MSDLHRLRPNIREYLLLGLLNGWRRFEKKLEPVDFIPTLDYCLNSARVNRESNLMGLKLSSESSRTPT
ncbi:unnamed protein product [Protopolystoma xenopodis]|uniref:Uncharacterized protein n=1 Tax=Protopolystoma xenopodis TaxID=117903 RepID=A0A3S5BE05_9PLAT|nr:unnamed protein product [Protopolystoma xenopodis]